MRTAADASWSTLINAFAFRTRNIASQTITNGNAATVGLWKNIMRCQSLTGLSREVDAFAVRGIVVVRLADYGGIDRDPLGWIVFRGAGDCVDVAPV